MGRVTGKLTYLEALDYMRDCDKIPQAPKLRYAAVISRQRELERRTIHDIAETNPYLRDALRRTAR